MNLKKDLKKLNKLKMNCEKIRVIPKLEIKNQHLIKGVRYEGLRKVGDPVEVAKKYFEQGADQINIIDIVASLYSRDNLYDIINKITDQVFIPVCVGGGVKSVNHIRELLKSGADRVIINSEALRNPKFILEVSKTFGAQFLSISIEAKKFGTEYYCMMDHGREKSPKKVGDWLKELKNYQIGEVIISSIDNDGMEEGFDLELAKIANNAELKCSKVISGGAGNVIHVYELLNLIKFDGVSLGASLHFNKIKINELKNYLLKQKININTYD
jgi:imidazole glycerol-phosphate synthase subunit HisF